MAEPTAETDAAYRDLVEQHFPGMPVNVISYCGNHGYFLVLDHTQVELAQEFFPRGRFMEVMVFFRFVDDFPTARRLLFPPPQMFPAVNADGTVRVGDATFASTEDVAMLLDAYLQGLDQLATGSIFDIMSTLHAPNWEDASKCHDWRNHVPDLIQTCWELFTLEGKQAIWYMAQQAADREEYD